MFSHFKSCKINTLNITNFNRQTINMMNFIKGHNIIITFFKLIRRELINVMLTEVILLE